MKLLAACAISASFGIGLSLPTPFEASYRNHVDIQELCAEVYYNRLDYTSSRIADFTKKLQALDEKEEEEYWIRILETAQSNPYMAKMAAQEIAAYLQFSNKFNNKKNTQKWSKRAKRVQSFATVKEKDSLEWLTLYSRKEGGKK